MSSLRERALKAKDASTEIAPVPEWGDGWACEMRGFSLDARTKLIKDATDDDGEIDQDKLYGPLIVASAFDPETGEAVFTDADVDALRTRSAIVLDRLAGVALRLNGIDKTSASSAEKNSGATPSADSPSGSPKTSA